MLEKKFQFLIGKLKTVLCLREYLRVVLEFQFLIGRLKTSSNEFYVEYIAKFQFLIGRCEKSKYTSRIYSLLVIIDSPYLAVFS